ncbi:hypothetical protein [Halorubrum californiense]|uniref:hypothetical protein n=1 Tax=Halorubrum californiense TaxID=416585 RepID=UPI001268E422|nr:hypothetical protein [Halorubrum californiense]
MRTSDIVDLLDLRPGYEVVYLLLQSSRRRQELAEYANTNGGILQRWLERAEEEELITKDVSLRNEEKYVEYSLNCVIPTELLAPIEARGGCGPRKSRDSFADGPSGHHWLDDPYSLK